MIWGLLERPRNRALKEKMVPRRKEGLEITMETSVLLKSNGQLLLPANCCAAVSGAEKCCCAEHKF